MDWDWLTDWLDAGFAWLIELLLWVPQKLYGLLLDGLATVVEGIPAPSWASGISFAGVHNSIAYFGGPFHIDTGLTVVVSATLLRFLIRRLPVVG
jgi:hypothetical protein